LLTITLVISLVFEKQSLKLNCIQNRKLYCNSSLKTFFVVVVYYKFVSYRLVVLYYCRKVIKENKRENLNNTFINNEIATLCY